MRFRPSAGTVLASLLWALPGVVAMPTVAMAQDAPKNALITSVRGNTLTLAIGTDDGAKVGQTFRISRGEVSTKVQITVAAATESTAVVIASGQGLVITVGESATFVGEEPMAPAVPSTPAGPFPKDPNTPLQVTTPPGGNGPQQALITAVNGKTVTLGIGTADNAVLGAVYAVPLVGDVRARIQITEVRASESTGILTILDEGFSPTVGDTSKFIGIEAVQVTTPPVVPPVVTTDPGTTTPDTGSNVGATTPSPVTGQGITVSPAPVSSLSGSTATVTSIEGQSVVISAGTAQGAKPATNLPILRGGQVIGLVRLQVVSENSSKGTVLWRDESLSAIGPGDAVGILGADPSVGTPAIGTPSLIDDGKIPAVPVKWETGASNEAVPKANETYELLASLAAKGLIKSQNAYFFQDDGARRHSTQEDIILSKAQISQFVREAISNYEEGSNNSSANKAALARLTKEYKRDLMKLGESKETLESFQDGFSFGISSFSRYTLTGGDTDLNTRDPFPDSYGARRSKTGFDTRTNIFGQLTSQLSFYGSFDYGNAYRNGTSNIYEVSSTPLNQQLGDPLSNLQVRKAYLSYDASKLLRGLTVNLGRKEFWWGPGQYGTMLLGDAAGGLNSLSTKFERGSYRLEGMYSYLGRGPAGKHRSLYAQTLSVKVNETLRAGTTASVLTPNQRLDPQYFLVGFTPLSLYLVKGNSRQGDSNDNSVLGGFLEASVAKGARVYGEVLIDDMSLKTNPTIESRTGGVVGASFFNPRDPGRAGFKAEYARVNSYAYLALPGGQADNEDYYYYFRNSPLGYPIGPQNPTTDGGAESIRFEGYYSPLKKLRLYGGIEFNDINTGDQNFLDATPVRGLSRQQVRRIAVSYSLSKRFTLTGRAQEVRTDQPNFLRNEPSQTDRFVSFELSRSF